MRKSADPGVACRLGRGPGLALGRRGGFRGPEERGELFLGGALEGELLLEAAYALGEEEGLFREGVGGGGFEVVWRLRSSF